jgi:hypothetical protein
MTLSTMAISRATFSITTLNIKGLFVKLGINNTGNHNTAMMPSVFMLSVAFNLLIC